MKALHRYVAVIGAGNFGMRHLETLRRIEGVAAIAVSRRKDRLEELHRQGYATAPDIAAAARMGATSCIVATETSRHVPDTIAAVREGLRVLVEKPMAVDAIEAAEARSACASGQVIYVGCVLRFSESLDAFKEQLPRIGRVHHVRIECQSYLPSWRPGRPYRETYSASAAEGGIMRDLIHEIDYAGWIFGWPESLSARVRNLDRLGIDAEESADLVWEVSGGVLVSMTLDCVTRRPQRRMRAVGEEGAIEWDGIAGRVTLSTESDETKTFSQTADQRLLKQDAAFIFGNPVDPCMATADDGIRALAICDAARAASASGRSERVVYR